MTKKQKHNRLIGGLGGGGGALILGSLLQLFLLQSMSFEVFLFTELVGIILVGFAIIVHFKSKDDIHS